MIPPRDLLLAPRRLPPECRDHEDAGLSVASRVRTLQLPQRGCRVQGPSPKVASRLSSALGMPAASTLLDLVPGGSRLYWRGWGGRQTVNRPTSWTGKAPESPGGTTSYAVHRARRGVGGTRWGRGVHCSSRGGLRSGERQRGLCKRSHGPGRQTTLNSLGLLVVTPGQTIKLSEPQGRHLSWACRDRASESFEAP